MIAAAGRSAGSGSGAGAAGAENAPLLTRKLRWRCSLVMLTSWLPVSRHQAGRSCSTEDSCDRISSSWPGSNGSMCLRISSNRPFPQSSSPPSKDTKGGYGWLSA